MKKGVLHALFVIESNIFHRLLTKPLSHRLLNLAFTQIEVTP